jgi:hypothetical protein
MNQRPPTLVPESFFADAEGANASRNVFGDIRREWSPSAAMLWYDGIIDDLLANPGTSLKAVAQRLGRSYSVVNTVVNSDLFRARYEQRRAQFNEALDRKLTHKIAAVAEAALDHTLTALETKRDAIPLPQLMEIAQGSLDRLGYAPQKVGGAASVQVNVGTIAGQTVSAEGLARAREHLKIIEGRRLPDGSAPLVSAAGSAPLAPSPPQESPREEVAGPSLEGQEEED